MTRQSITFTEPNEDWLAAQVESKEFHSKSEVVNDLIRKARAEQETINAIRAKLRAAEKSGFTSMTPDEILAEIKEKARSDGLL